MALVVESVTLLPALGALGALGVATLLPCSATATTTALRAAHAQREDEDDNDQRDAEPSSSSPSSPQVDGLTLQRLDGDLDLDLDIVANLRNLERAFRQRGDDSLYEGMSTRQPPQGYDSDGDGGARPGLDTWSVVWYCGMFAAFTSLFLIMPCSQVLCRAGLLHGQGDPRLRPRAPLGALHAAPCATPPPPYKQFAPPAYEDVILDMGLAPPPGKAVPLAAPLGPPPPSPPTRRPEKPDKEGALEVYVIPLRLEASAATQTHM